MASSPSLASSPSPSPSSSSSFAAVLVAVRVRPFSQREREGNARLVVHMCGGTGKVTELRSPNGSAAGGGGQSRRFTFDHSYWSHDGFSLQPDGYLTPVDARYADQRRLFEDLGKEVLRNAWAGYNCSLFAYGQTGSGKSYSMVGFGPNKGIVPMLCNELFRGIDSKKAAEPEANFRVSISMLEIYCEKVRDLLASERRTSKGGLKVREHPTSGFYVEGLSCWPVSTGREIERWMAQGTKMRTFAATSLNETSSRAHTIVRLQFTQLSAAGSTRQSEINLVDLAGSERQKQAGSEGDRLKEGILINRSLSTLGRVIQALHDRQSSRQKKQKQGAGNGAEGHQPQVPYRDSVLTSLLRNALGGNSKTIMIAAISPSEFHFEETLSTLRFADRVKRIRTRPVVNESQTERLIRELRRQNGRLQEMLRKDGLTEAATQDELEALRQQLADNQREMERLERSWHHKEETLKRQLTIGAVLPPSKPILSRLSLEQDSLERRRKEVPHLWNLNEDPALSNVIVHFVEEGENKVGNSMLGGNKPQILLKGLNILPEHAILRNNGNKRVTVCPLHGADILVNGRPIRGPTELHQNDRVHFGGNHLYVFANPRVQQRGGAQPSRERTITFQMAQKEIAQQTTTGGSSLMAGQRHNNSKTKEELVLEEELISLLPYVYRANSMAKELKKNVSYEIVLLPPEATEKTAAALTEVWVKVHDRSEDTTFLWDSSRFMSRYYGMQQFYEGQVEGTGGQQSATSKERDPFLESPSFPLHLGSATVFLQSLAYLIELDEQIPILDLNGLETGRLLVSLRPCDVNGQEMVNHFVDSSQKLLGQNLGIKVKLVSAIGLPQKIEKSYCKYRFFDREQVSTVPRTGCNPVYAHEKTFWFKPVTEQLLDFLTEGTLLIEVFAIQRQGQIPTSKIVGNTTDISVEKVTKTDASGEEKHVPRAAGRMRRASSSDTNSRSAGGGSDEDPALAGDKSTRTRISWQNSRTRSKAAVSPSVRGGQLQESIKKSFEGSRERSAKAKAAVHLPHL